MVKVYVNSKKECPADAVLRQGPNGGSYYVPEERGDAAEVGGVDETFEDLFTPMTKDDPLDEVVEVVADQILPSTVVTEEFKSRVVSEILNRVEGHEISKEIVIEVVEDMSDTNKNRMQRVYVNSEDEVPDEYVPMRDDNGDLYYVRDDEMFIDSGRTSQKEYELREGLSWTERVMVTDIDEDEGVVTMVDTEGPSEWEEDIEDVEAKLKTIEAVDHDWMYELIAGEYASLDEEEVHEALHDAAGLDKGVRRDYQERMEKDEDPCWEGYTMVGTKENGDPRCVPDDEVEDYDPDKSQKSLVYVGGPDEVPEGYTPQQGERGGWYYDTSEEPSRGFGGAVQDMAENIVDGLTNILQGPSQASTEMTDEQRQHLEDLASRLAGGRMSDPEESDMPPNVSPQASGGSLSPEDRERMEEIAARAMGEQLDLIRADELGPAVVDSLSKSQISDDDMVEALLFLDNEFDFFELALDESEVSKSRVYVSDPSEVPEGYDAQQGAGGGIYYETGGGDPGVADPDPESWDEATDGMSSDEEHELMQDVRRVVEEQEGQNIDDLLYAEGMHSIEELVNEYPEFLQMVDGKSRKSRVYVSDESEVPDQYEVQEGQGGGLYYETDSGEPEQDRETVDDDVTDEQIGEMEDNISEHIEGQESDLRDMGEDMVYELIEEDPSQDVEEINEQVQTAIADRVMDEIQSEYGVELEGHAYDEASEAIYESLESVFEDVEATAEEMHIQEQNIDTDPV